LEWFQNAQGQGTGNREQRDQRIQGWAAGIKKYRAVEAIILGITSAKMTTNQFRNLSKTNASNADIFDTKLFNSNNLFSKSWCVMAA
jgi:hypothetical protein